MRPGAPRTRRRRDRRAAPAAPPGLAARAGAVRLLGAVLDRGRMLDEAALDGLELAPAERAEARGLADLVLRRLGQIDDLLSRFAERRPPAPADHVLRVMAGSIIFGGTAPHAAVDLAVRQVKAGRGTARLAGLVNALGRRVAAEGAGIAAGQDAAELDTPEWLAARLTADWGAGTARAIAEAHLPVPPLDLTPRAAEDAPRLAEALDARLLPTGSLRRAARVQLTALPGFAEGAWWAQDAAAALPARLIPAPAGRRVLDLCAAPGGKTMQLAAAGARVTALDISERRMERLAANLARTGLSAEAVVADALDWQPQAPFDAILIDAPCSATGTIRRHPDLPWRTGADDLPPLLSLQERLLERAFGWLAPGGVLVYAVCSLLKDEGEAQARRFLAATPGARLEPLTGEMPAELLDETGCLRTRPDHWAETGGLDGFFAARIRRAG